MARKLPTPTKPPECSLCGTNDGAIHPCADGFICLPCQEQWRTGRDATTRAARAMKYSAEQRVVAVEFRKWGDEASAGIHDGHADEYEGKAEALLRVDAIPPMALGEAVPAKRSRLVDTLKRPDTAALDASAHRLELLGRMGLNCIAMAQDAAASIEAGNSLEKMLAHQLAAAHKVALEITAKGMLQQDSIEKARMLNLACRMMETYQKGLLTFQRLRSNGEQRITVQYINVGEGGQAVVGDVHRGGGDGNGG